MKNFRDFLNEDNMINEKSTFSGYTLYYDDEPVSRKNIFNVDGKAIEKLFDKYFFQDSYNEDAEGIDGFFKDLNKTLKIKDKFSTKHMVTNLHDRRILFVSDSKRLRFLINWN